MPAAKTVDRYLAGLPDDQRKALEKLRLTIRAAAPKAEETISYQMPTFKQNGILLSFAAFKNHCSLFVVQGSLPTQVEKHLKDFRTSKGTLQFTPEHPIPVTLVRRIVKARVAANAEKAKARTARVGKQTK